MRLCITPAVLPGQFQDELTNRFRRGATPDLDGLQAPAFTVLPNPAPQRGRMHDRNELVDRLAELRSKSHQSVPLPKCDRNSRRQLAPQDLIFHLQVLDLAGQFLLRGPRDQKQKLRVDVPHGRCRRKMLSSMGMTSFLHTGMAADSRKKAATSTSAGACVRLRRSFALSKKYSQKFESIFWILETC